MSIGDRNNSAGRMIAKGKLDEAERVLDRIEKELGPSPEPMDEYFDRVHRVVIAWHRARYEEALPHARRAYALELELLETESAFGAGSWGILSVLTRLRRFGEARAIFDAVVKDDSAFSARCGNNREEAEKILVAGMCIFFESKDFAPHRKLVRRAKKLAVATPSSGTRRTPPPLACTGLSGWTTTAALNGVMLALFGRLSR